MIIRANANPLAGLARASEGLQRNRIPDRNFIAVLFTLRAFLWFGCDRYILVCYGMGSLYAHCIGK